jgi:putative FmdB family regulatory protein
MAAYDYRCRACERVFEVRRPMTAETADIRCPCGHDDVTRVWSAVALAGAPGAEPAPAAGGGCCGGGCCG